MKYSDKILEGLFEEILGPIVSWAVIFILAGVFVAAAYLWVAVFVL